jgi:hypothetical protein
MTKPVSPSALAAAVTELLAITREQGSSSSHPKV